MKHPILRRILLSFGIMLLFAVSAFAQIQGDIVNLTGQGVPNAIITATDTVTKVIDTVKSDIRGFYAFNGLRPGNYIIEAKAAGFRSAIYKNIRINEGETGAIKGELDLYRGQRLDISLTPAKIPK